WFEYDERAPLDAQVVVCIASAPYMPIDRTLRERGFTNVAPFYDLAQSLHADHPLNNGWLAPPLTEEDKREIERGYGKLGDDVSRAHSLQFLSWRIAREELVFPAMPVTDDKYFIPEVVSMLHDHEVFLDGGAYDGRVSKQFASVVNNRFL